jgi:pyruvate,water dikinase
MDMEWAKDGIDGKLYMVQARPETVHSKDQGHILETYRLEEASKVLLEGQAVGKKIGSGRVRKMDDLSALEHFREGDVLVAKTTSPDWEPVMKMAAAIITESGGRTCHAAIVSRELGIPAIVGAQEAFERLKEEEDVTVSCVEGERGKVYEGLLHYEVIQTDLRELPKTRTEIMMNLGNPDMAFSLASLPVEGIGLARMEFIINTSIKAHPMALLYPEKTDEKTQRELTALTMDSEDNRVFFVRALSEGVATIASSVYPKPCIVRMSDFKSNEYASLIGGEFFEPREENPMIGFRGASRYSHPDYEEGFAMECAAMKRVREEMGFDNVVLMIPFCRRVAEARQVLETMEKYGLKRGENGLEVYMMCELPGNVISIDAYSAYFDGFSIGSNDLTQLTLGVDRDSDIVAFDYDERDSGVMKLIEMAIEGAKRNGKHSGICGQAPSDYPEVAEALVKMGIDSISLNPDTVLQTLQHVGKLEMQQRE